MPPRVKQTAAERQRQKYPDSFLVLFYNPSGKHKDTFSIDGTHCIYDYGLMKLSGNYDQGILLVRPK